MTYHTRLIEVAEWEYNTLIADLKAQGEEWSYTGGFEAWFEEIFLKEDTWEEIREDVKLNYEEA